MHTAVHIVSKLSISRLSISKLLSSKLLDIQLRMCRALDGLHPVVAVMRIVSITTSISRCTYSTSVNESD